MTITDEEFYNHDYHFCFTCKEKYNVEYKRYEEGVLQIIATCKCGPGNSTVSFKNILDSENATLSGLNYKKYFEETKSD